MGEANGLRLTVSVWILSYKEADNRRNDGRSRTIGEVEPERTT